MISPQMTKAVSYQVVQKLPGSPPALRTSTVPDAADTGGYADKVSISRVAQDLSDGKIDLGSFEHFSQVAHASETDAKELASLFATGHDAILYTAESVYRPPWRLASTNEIATHEAEADFDSKRQSVEIGRKTLYKAELAKGTPYADIVDKIINYNNKLPMDYRKFTGWGLQFPDRHFTPE